MDVAGYTPVLLVSADDAVKSPLRRHFKENKFGLVEESDHVRIWHQLESVKPHLVLLDNQLPGTDSLEVCERIRSVSNVPIVVIGNQGDAEDVVHALNCGCDDYIARPFNLYEVVARVKAKLRRAPLYLAKDVAAGNAANQTEKVAGIRVDPKKKLVHANGRNVQLTAKEFELLLVLINRPGEVFSSSELYELAWRRDSNGDTRTVLVCIYKLRQKLEQDPSNPKYILSERGRGYHFRNERACGKL